MCGSFESGAGDNPDDLFKEETDESTDESAEVEELESSSAENEDASSQSLHRTEADEVETDTEDNISDASSMSITLERTDGDLDDAEIAQQFIPDDYDKPYPWALGRDNALDGRPNKMTFFLQTKTLDIEERCLDEVNDILDGDVPQTDLREIALIVAYHQPELLAKIASAWGAESA